MVESVWCNSLQEFVTEYVSSTKYNSPEVWCVLCTIKLNGWLILHCELSTIWGGGGGGGLILYDVSLVPRPSSRVVDPLPEEIGARRGRPGNEAM